LWEQDAFLPGLAIPLNNLGGMLSFLERREEALQAIDEAVGIYRQTGRTTPRRLSPWVRASYQGTASAVRTITERRTGLAAEARLQG